MRHLREVVSRSPMLAGIALHAYRSGRDPESDEQAWYGLMIDAASRCSQINWAEE